MEKNQSKDKSSNNKAKHTEPKIREKIQQNTAAAKEVLKLSNVNSTSLQGKKFR